MKKIATALACVVGFVCTTHADIIAAYDFGTPTAPTNVASTVISGASASEFTGHAGLGGYVISTTIGDQTGQLASGTTWGSTETCTIGDTSNDCTGGGLAGAITDGDYWSFILTADAPGSLTITDFSLATAIAGAKSAEKYNVLAQVDGGTTWAAGDALTTDQVTTVLQNEATYQALSLDLSSDTTFQNIDSVEFRIYAWGGSSNASSSRTVVDQVAVEGTISSIPEPSALTLLSLGGAVLLRMRNRKS